MPAIAHVGLRWRRRSKWPMVWRRTLGGMVVMAFMLLCFWALVGACESTVVGP